MATVSPPPPVRSRDESQRRVASPLDKLRGAIRLYVSAEGTAVFLLYIALWFWIGLLLDYVFFKVTGIDWVQVLSHGFRLGLLLVLLSGLLAVVAVKVVLRLIREFREAALALVLERRFPKVLGDRLITAVELADPRVADKYGYSQAMVEQTIHDAAERVEKVPVQNVFNWRRLTRAFVLVACLTLGIYITVGVGFWVYQALKSEEAAAKNRREGIGDFAGRFGDVAGIWFERNILLADTIWPRRAYLELLDFSGDERRIGRDAPPPNLRVRAYKWVVADSNRERAPEGWRALRWDELGKFVTGRVPEVPDTVRPPHWRGTVDEIELQLARDEIRQQLDSRDLIAALDELETQSTSASMSRRLRKLDVPDEVYVISKGASSSNEQTLKKQGDNEYAGNLADLKESIRFTIRGEDYYTPYRRIIVVPPPEVVELTRDEAQPAYLFYRLPRGTEAEELRGKKQLLRDVPVSLTGDTSRFEVPAGTDVVLKARTDKELRRPDGVRNKPRPGSAAPPEPVEQIDEHQFQIRLPGVKAVIDLTFEITDTDNVTGQRRVIVTPAEDLPPEVDVQIEVVRKTNQGYLVSPQARVPFSGKVRDDHGVSKVEYLYTVARIEAAPSPRARAALMAAAVPLAGGPFDQQLSALALFHLVSRGPGEQEATPDKSPLLSFDRALKDRESFETPLTRLLPQLADKPPSRVDVDRALIKEHVLDQDSEVFDIGKLNLKSNDERAVQPHYRLRLSVQATDSDIETGPHVGLSKERFTLIVVSENELLAEIAKEEEALHIKLEESVNKLKDARLRLEKIIQELDDPKVRPDEFVPLGRRSDDVRETVDKSADVAREVLGDYTRILNELRVNRVQSGIISRVDEKICQPLEVALRDEFQWTGESLREATKSIEAKNRDPKPPKLAMENLQKLLDRLGNVLDAMADITTINNLIKSLIELEQSEAAEMKKLEDLKTKTQEKILEGLIKQ